MMPWCFRHVLSLNQHLSSHALLLSNRSPQRAKKSSHSSFLKARRLSAGAPDVLEVAVTLSEAVDAVVGLAHGADEAAESVGLGLAVESAVLVDLCDGDLDGTVVLGLDDAVGGAALAGDVTAACENMSAFFCSAFFSFCLRLCVCVGVSCVLSLSLEGALWGLRDGRTDQGIVGGSYRSTSSPRSFSMVTVL